MLRSLFHSMRRRHLRYRQGPLWFRVPRIYWKNRNKKNGHSFPLLLWCMAWYERSLTKPARLMLIVFFITSFVCSVSVDSPALPLFFCMFAVSLCDSIIGWIVSPRLQITRTLPDRVICRVPFPVVNRIRNLRKRLPAFSIFPDPFAVAQHWRQTGTEEHRTILPEEQVTFKTEFTAFRRGIIQFPVPAAESAFPFFLWKHLCFQGDARSPVLVHPYYEKMPDLLRINGRTMPKETGSSGRRSGNSMDYFGNREFQYGDPLRRVDWKASARHNSLVVREYEEQAFSGAAVLTDAFYPVSTGRNILNRDLFSGTVEKPDWEAALSLSASLIHTLTQTGIPVLTFTCGSSWLTNPYGALPEKEMLDRLALADTIAHGDPLPELMEKLSFDNARIRSFYGIFCRWDDAAGSLLAMLEKARIPSKFYLVTKKKGLAGLPETVELIHPSYFLPEGKR